MKWEPRTDRRLLVAMGAFLLLALVLVALMARADAERRRADAFTTLEQADRLTRVRIDAFIMEMAEDLREETQAMTGWQEHDVAGLVGRWRPLMDTHWPIVSIAVADELGNEHSLLRQDEGLVYRRVFEGSRKVRPTVCRVNGPSEALVIGKCDTLTGSRDPRKRTSFSKALENSGDSPVWHLAGEPEDAGVRLKAAQLFRDPREDRPFRILTMKVDLARSRWLDAWPTPVSRHGSILLDGDGHVLNLTESGEVTRLREAGLAAASAWRADKTQSTFEFTVQGARHLATVGPYQLNGETLFIVTVLDISGTTGSSGMGVGLVTMAVLLLFVAGILAALWLGRQREEETLRRQAHRSRSQEKRLAKALGEREVLNREVHHRVKNNLQVVSSLLNLQAARLEDGPIRDEFLRGKRRIDLMALVHHKLYGLQDLRRVDMEQFINDLMRELSSTFKPASGTVSHEVRSAEVRCDQDTAINLGIMLCELVGNAYTHAFPYATGGHIEIHVQLVEGDLHRLIVKDNGKGLQPGHANGPGKLGLEIVEALADQLDGSFHIRTNGGTTFEVLFRIPREPQPEIEEV